MAVEPLYNSTLSVLLKKARINTADDLQTLEAVYQAVRDVRIGFFQQLGRSRALEIRDIPETENPEDDDGILRLTASSAEAVWLTVLLITRLPVLFMDNRASTGDAFNDEPLTRDAAGLKELLEEQKGFLTDMLAALADDDSYVKHADKASLNGPDEDYLLSEHRIGAPDGC